MEISVIVLAGGESQRMGTDKAFLTYRGRPFVKIITDEMHKISEDVLVVIGRKIKQDFECVLDRRVIVLND